MGKERHGIHLIAEMANVSIGTVDRALHGRGGIKEATRQRILQARDFPAKLAHAVVAVRFSGTGGGFRRRHGWFEGGARRLIG